MKIDTFFLVKWAVLLVLLTTTPLVHSDQREDNIDLFLLLDKSRSMIEEIQEVKQYLGGFLFDQFIIPGDRVTVILFYGESELLYSEVLKDREMIAQLQNRVEEVIANGHYTDIGGGLDTLKAHVESIPSIGLQQYLLLITDGVQEAPVGSRYYSSDGNFDHSYLDNTKQIIRSGWKLQVIGLGEATAARDIALELSGIYRELSGEVTAEELEGATEMFLGVVSPLDPPTLSRLNRRGEADFLLSISSSGYQEDVTVQVDSVFLELNDGTRIPVLADNTTYTSSTISVDGEGVLSLPLNFSQLEEGESVEGTLLLGFAGDVQIVPSTFPVKVTRPGPIVIPVPLIATIGGVLLLLLAVFVIILLVRRNQRRFIPLHSLQWSIEGANKLDQQLKLPYGEVLSLRKIGDQYEVVKGRVRNSLAVFTFGTNGVFLKPLPQGVIEALTPTTGNLLDNSLKFRVGGEQEIALSFTKKATN